MCLLLRDTLRRSCRVPNRASTGMLAMYVQKQNSPQLDKLARERLKRDGESPPDDTPLSRAFACDMLQQQTIHQSIADIQATWPDRFIGTCAYNGSIRKRGEFLKVTMEQLKDSLEASVYVLSLTKFRLLYLCTADPAQDGGARPRRLASGHGCHKQHSWPRRVRALCRSEYVLRRN